MIIKHGFKSWADLLHFLKINEHHLKDSDLKKLEKWCQNHIKSSFSASNLKSIKIIVDFYLKLNSHNTPTSVINSEIGGLNVIQKAAQLDFDVFLNEMLSLCSGKEKNEILNSKTNGGNTPLHYAGLYGNQNSLDTLLQHGANPNVTNANKRSPIYLSALPLNKNQQQSKECVLLLFNQTDNNFLKSEQDIGMSFLIPLMQMDNIELIKNILKERPNLFFAKDELNQNLLHLAIINNNEPLVNFFLRSEQSEHLVAEKTGNGSTALHLACRYGNDQIIQSLLTHPLCNEKQYLDTHDEHMNIFLDYLNERNKGNLYESVEREPHHKNFSV